MSGSKQSSSRSGKSKSVSGKRKTIRKHTHKTSAKTKVRHRKSSKKSQIKLKNAFFISALVSCLLLIFYAVYLDQKIVDRFEGRIWKLPAHVYSRPLELYKGKHISAKQLGYELEYLNYQRVGSLPDQPATYRQWDDFFEIKTRDFQFWDSKENARLFRVKLDNDVITELTDPLTENSIDLVRFDAGYLTGIFPAHSQDRVLLKLDDVPDMLIKILLLTEDRRFFEHYGIDPRAIARALVVNLSSGGTVQGGSTLTQQLVKNLFLSQDKTLIRKINEAIMSLMLELHYDKRLILETYLNEVYLGQDGKRAIHGFGLASQFYFGKSAKDLSLDEMALLVGMVKGASYYNPKRNPENARERRNVILKTMLLEGLITERQYNIQSSRSVTTVKHASAGQYPAFIDAVKIQLQQDYHAEDLQSEGLTIFTTLDPYIQHVTERAVSSTLKAISKNSSLQSAAVVVSPNNGELLAIVGDRNPTYKGFNRAINAYRPIGSLIKPVIYLSAISSGQYTLASMLNDEPFVLSQPGQDDWIPQNYDKQFHGTITLYEALLNSYNIPAVKTAIDIGLPSVRKTAIALGASDRIEAFPSMALGATEMSPIEVASIYQSFAANGFNSPIRSVTAVLDNHQQPLERYPLDISSGAMPQAVAVINSALIDVTRYGTARRLAEELPIQVAGKTGTSDDLKDSWFAGFSGDAVAVVWVGFDDNTPTGLTGSSGAMRVWKNIMSSAAYSPFHVSESSALETYWIDRDNGLLSEQGCENAIELHFVRDTQPQQYSENSKGCNKGTNWFLDLFR
jgi:penicillin-binding protein 1B